MVSTVLQVLPLNWMHSKIISVAAFCIIGLTKIEFLPLDLIYRSIRIMTVPTCRCARVQSKPCACKAHIKVWSKAETEEDMNEGKKSVLSRCFQTLARCWIFASQNVTDICTTDVSAISY